MLVDDKIDNLRLLGNLLGDYRKAVSTINKNISISLNKSDIADKEEQFIQVVIQDEGMGIPADEMPHIFDKFNKLSNKPTSNEPSTGLGLAIVKLLCNYLKCKIFCNSIEGKGTIFTLNIPFSVE